MGGGEAGNGNFLELHILPFAFSLLYSFFGGGGGGGLPLKHLDSVDLANTLGEQIHTSIGNFGRIEIKIT